MRLWSAGAGCAVLLLAAAPGRAQVGLDAAACRARWGQPVVVREAGAATHLTFRAGELSIDCELEGDSVRRIAYRQLGLDADTLNSLLELNADGQSWHAWQAPGRAAPANGPRKWLRQDEMAFATCAGDLLTVLAGERESPPEPPARGATTNRVATVIAGATNSTPAKVLAAWPGYWLSRREAGPPVVLELRADGTLQWTEMGSQRRRTFDALWRREGEQRVALFAARERMPEDLEALRLGVIERADDGQVVFTRAEEGESARRLAADWLSEESVPLARVEAIPEWKPGAPAELPPLGASKAAVLRQLGEPTGVLAARGREILVYPWGRVWLDKGVVSSIE